MSEYYIKKFNYRKTTPEQICSTCKHSYKLKRYSHPGSKTLLKCPLQPKGVVWNKMRRKAGMPEIDATVGSLNVCDRWEVLE